MSDTQPQLYDVQATARRLSIGAAQALAEQWAEHGGRVVIYRRRAVWLRRVVIATFGGPSR